METFRRFQDKPGTLGNELNDNSYYVYIIHVIVLGSLAVILLDTAIPSLVKYLIVAISTFVASNVIVSLCRASCRNRAGSVLAMTRPAERPTKRCKKHLGVR